MTCNIDMKQLTINLLMTIILASCSMNAVPKDMPVDNETYQKDKQHICDTYIKNIEYFRLHYHDSDYFDNASLYSRYAFRITKNGKDIASPYPTDTQVNVEVDTIFYDDAGNLFVAFICVENNFTKDPALEDIEHAFDAWAMIGYRDSTDKALRMYPITKFATVNFKDKELAMRLNRRDYMTYLKWSGGLAGSVYKDRFRENVGEDSFFRKSQFFHKNDSNLYLFQLNNRVSDFKKIEYPFGTD